MRARAENAGSALILMILAATLDIISHSLEPQFLVYIAHGPHV